MKYKIQYVKKIPYGYIGMNYFASKPHHIQWNHKHPEHTLLIKKGMPHSFKVATENHEMCEEYFMKNKHYNYHKAHNLALKFENYNKPFPKTQIKRNLIKMGFLRQK